MAEDKQPGQSGQPKPGGITFDPRGGAALTVRIPPEIAARLAPGLIERVQRVSWTTTYEIADTADVDQLAHEYTALLEHTLAIQEMGEL